MTTYSFEPLHSYIKGERQEKDSNLQSLSYQPSVLHMRFFFDTSINCPRFLTTLSIETAGFEPTPTD